MTRPGLTRIACAAMLCLGVVLALARPARSSPLDLFGFGGRSPALAGAGVASATGYDAVYLNPAGLADAPGKRMTLGTMAGDMFLYLDDVRTNTDRISSLLIGGAVPIPFGGALEDRVVLGLGFQIPFSTINRARQPLPGEPIYALLENRSFVISIQGAVGVKLSPRWRVGAGILALAELQGTIDVTTDAAGRFTTFSEQQLITRVAPILGARYLMPEHSLALGVTFRGVSRSDYDIVVTSDLGDAIPLSLPTVHIAGTAQYDPLTLAVEAAWQWTPALALHGQLAYQRWSAYPQPTMVPVEGRPALDLPGFHDIAVPRIAIEWTRALGATRIGLRGGYSFIYSPAPEMSGRQSLLDNHRHVISTGLGLAWPGTRLPLHIDAWMQVHALMPRSHSKDPTRFDPDEVMPFDTIATRGSIVVGGLTMGVDL